MIRLANTTEKGYVVDAGLSSWSSLLADDEENPELQWPKSVRVFDKMRREEAQVGSVLRAVTLPIRSANWYIDPTGCRPEVVEHVATDMNLPVKGRDPVPALRTKGRFSWSEHLRLALLELAFGHAFFEQVYRLDDANLLHIKKLAYRPPRTISKIEVASDGGLVAIEQHGWSGSGGPSRIEVQDLVAYVNEREGGAWAGQSLLRQAYKNWLLKDRALRTQSVTLERNGLGVPVYEGAPVPENSTPDQRDRWIESERSNGLQLAKDLRSGPNAGASIPHGASIDLKGVTGTLPNSDEPIRYHDEQIARAVLAHFLNLGTETGSWALGSTFADFFVQSLQAVAEHICDVTQQHVIEDLVDLNWGESEPAPRLVFEAIGSKTQATADAIKILIDCGAIEVDEGVEDHMRQTYGLPHKNRTTGTTSKASAKEAANTAQKVYLAYVNQVISRNEARSIIAAMGFSLEEMSNDQWAADPPPGELPPEEDS